MWGNYHQLLISLDVAMLTKVSEGERCLCKPCCVRMYLIFSCIQFIAKTLSVHVFFSWMSIPQKCWPSPFNNMASSSKELEYSNSLVANKVEIVFSNIKSAQLLIKHITINSYEQVIHILCKQVGVADFLIYHVNSLLSRGLLVK